MDIIHTVIWWLRTLEKLEKNGILNLEQYLVAKNGAMFVHGLVTMNPVFLLQSEKAIEGTKLSEDSQEKILDIKLEAKFFSKEDGYALNLLKR